MISCLSTLIRHADLFSHLFCCDAGLEVDRIDYPDTALVMWDTRQHFEDMVRTSAVSRFPLQLRTLWRNKNAEGHGWPYRASKLCELHIRTASCQAYFDSSVRLLKRPRNCFCGLFFSRTSGATTSAGHSLHHFRGGQCRSRPSSSW